jgi:hypothetical protein
MVSPHRLWDNIVPLPLSWVDDYDVVSGHFGVSFVDLFDFDLVAFTFLRHPVDRTLSHFMHVKRDRSHRYHQYVADMTLADFLADPTTIPLVYNLQSRYLSFEISGFDCKSRLPREPSRRGDLAVTWELMSYGMKDSDIRDLSLRSLKRLNFVGLVEEFDTSMRRLTALLKVDDCYVSKLNASPNVNDIANVTPAMRERILDLNRIDMELYDIAKNCHDHFGLL